MLLDKETWKRNRGCADLLIGGVLLFFVFWAMSAAGCCGGVANAQESRTLVGPGPRSPEERAAALHWQHATKITHLAELPERPQPSYLCLDPEGAKENDTGILDGWQFRVLQIVGPNDLLLRAGGKLVWLSGYPTDDFVNDEAVRIIGPVVAGETKTYQTAIGARTVRVVRLVPAEKLAEIAAEKAAAEKEAAEAAAAEAWQGRWEEGKRTWTDASGSFRVEAIYDGFEPGHVWLMKADRARVKVPLLRLSDADRREAVAQARAAGDLK